MEVQRLIGEVAKRHNVRLGPDDPILITVTLNELILAEYIEHVNVLIERAENQASVGAAQQVEAAKELASKLVTGAGVYVSDQLKAAGQVVQTQLLDMIGREIEKAREAAVDAASARRSAMRAAIAAVAVAGVLVGVMIGLWIPL